jgi:hypothetical protein
MNKVKNREQLTRLNGGEAIIQWLYRNKKHLLDKYLPTRSISSQKWTFEKCYDEVMKYETISEWRKKSRLSYRAAKHNKWLPRFLKLLINDDELTLKDCQLEALKYNSRGEWSKKSSRTYSVAYRAKWLDKCTVHMVGRAWTLERCKQEALKYKTRKEWEIKHKSSYSAAGINGWRDRCAIHMPRNAKLKFFKCVETDEIWNNQSECARKMNLSDRSINAVLIGRCKTANGFTFFYCDEHGNPIKKDNKNAA